VGVVGTRISPENEAEKYSTVITCHLGFVVCAFQWTCL
jgi:hypothetical protein